MVALGVDFGTSHTVAVARWPDGRVRPLLFDGSPLLPSAVFAEEAEDSALLVGRDALHGARREPAWLEPNPKRRIDDTDVLLGARVVPVRQLLAAVFGRVRAEFVRTTGKDPSSMALTHPAQWASTRRQALLDAALVAQLPPPMLVPEPVAAASYLVRVLGHQVPIGSAVVVYDMGAGTFDGSVVVRTQTGFEVLAVDGCDDLGGLDLDEVVLEMIGRACPPEAWRRLTAPTTPAEARAALLLRAEARDAKERLSRTAAVTILVPLVDLDVPLTRPEFEERARPMIERSVRVILEVVRLSRVKREQVAGVFLVGGASRTPMVATELHRAFGRPPVTIEQPELVVAEGSALIEPPVLRPAQSGPVSPGPVSPGPVSPGPVSLVAVSPAGKPASVPYLPVPVQWPVPYQVPTARYPQQSPIVFIPPYLPVPIRRRPPWTIRWPARVMRIYVVLLGLLVVLYGLVALPVEKDKQLLHQNQRDALIFEPIFVVYGILLLHAAVRLRRGSNGHLWYPILLLSIPAVLIAIDVWWYGLPALLYAAILDLPALLVLLPSARSWIRRDVPAPG